MSRACVYWYTAWIVVRQNGGPFSSQCQECDTVLILCFVLQQDFTIAAFKGRACYNETLDVLRQYNEYAGMCTRNARIVFVLFPHKVRTDSTSPWSTARHFRRIQGDSCPRQHREFACMRMLLCNVLALMYVCWTETPLTLPVCAW